MTEGVRGGGDSDEKWAGSDGQGLGPQGLRFRLAEGSGQMGRVGSQVRWGLGGQEGKIWDGLGPGDRRIFDPILFIITVPQTPSFLSFSTLLSATNLHRFK